MKLTAVEASWLVDNVGKIDFLSALSPEQLNALAKNAEPRLVAGTEIVIKEGQPGNSFFLVYNGSLSVWIEADGKRIKLANLKRGDFFGEISLLSGKPATADVVAKAPSKLFFLDRDKFVALVRSHRPLAEKIMTVAKERLARRKKAVEMMRYGNLDELANEIRAFLKA